MNKLLTILLIIVIISGCNTSKRMQKQIGKIHVTHPELLTKYCAEEFPVKETVTIVKGKDSIVYSTTVVDCDSAFRELQKLYPNEPIEVIREKLKTVYVPKIETKYRVDTITKVQENTAKLKTIEAENSILKRDLEKAHDNYVKAKKASNRKSLIVVIVATLLMLYAVLRFKRIL